MDEGRFYALLRFEEASLALRVALRLGIVDRLKNQKLSLREMGDKFDFTEQAGRTFFSLLHVMGILEKSETGFQVTTVAANCLSDDSAASRKPYLAMGTSEDVDSMIDLLREKITQDALPLYGTESGGQTVMDQEPVAREIAVGLASRARNFAEPLSESLTRMAPDAKSLADIGAGSPYVANACLKTMGGLEKVTLVDRPNGMKFAREIAQSEGMSPDRLEYYEADFFDTVPAADVYVLSNTAHDWLVNEYSQIVENISKVIPQGGMICIHEPLLLTSWNSETEWTHALWMACYAQTLFRLTLGKGTCYTLDEHQKILTDCGYNPVGRPAPTSDGCTAMFFS